MNRLKHLQILRLQEEQFTQSVCPGVRVENWMLAWVYRHGNRFTDEVALVKPEYMTTPTAKALFAKVQESQAGHLPSLRKLDRLYRTEAEQHPDRAQEIQSIRDHIAQLMKIPRTLTRRNKTVRESLRAWCSVRSAELRSQEMDRLLARCLAESRRMGDKLKELVVRYGQEPSRLPEQKQAVLEAARDWEADHDLGSFNAKLTVAFHPQDDHLN